MKFLRCLIAFLLFSISSIWFVFSNGAKPSQNLFENRFSSKPSQSASNILSNEISQNLTNEKSDYLHQNQDIYETQEKHLATESKNHEAGVGIIFLEKMKVHEASLYPHEQNFTKPKSLYRRKRVPYIRNSGVLGYIYRKPRKEELLGTNHAEMEASQPQHASTTSDQGINIMTDNSESIEENSRRVNLTDSFLDNEFF